MFIPTVLISWASNWRETQVRSWSWLSCVSESQLGLCHSSPLCCFPIAVPTLMWWEHPSEPCVQRVLQRTRLSLTSGVLCCRKHAELYSNMQFQKNKNSEMLEWLALNYKTQISSDPNQFFLKNIYFGFSYDSGGKTHLCVNFFPFCVRLRGNLQLYYCTYKLK